MKKIGIVTFYDAKNYGAFLQCFATQKALEKKYNVSIISYSNSEISKNYKIIKTSSVKKFIKSIVFLKKNIERNKKFNSAINNYLKLTSIDENYDVVIAGSDQIWNIELTNGLDKIFSLQYFNNVKKISYASSIGKENLVKKNRETYMHLLNQLDKISVREESARNELIKLSTKDIKVNLDPTLLISPKEWEKYINKNDIEEKYIFSYFVAVTQDNYDALEMFSNKLGLNVLSYSENPKEKNIIKKCYEDGPFEFISRIKYANYIFTSSFHGTVFSILFNKKFICMLPIEKSNRIVNLLSKLGLENRIIKCKEDLENFDFDEDIDYESVNCKLEKLREESINWLFDAVGE